MNLDIFLSALVPCASVRLELKIMNTFSCSAIATVVIVETSLIVSRTLLVHVDPENLSSTDLCNLLSDGKDVVQRQ